MGAAEVLVLVNSLLNIALQLYSSVSQIQGTTPIPTWEELVTKNAILQAKIDAEKDIPTSPI